MKAQQQRTIPQAIMESQHPRTIPQALKGLATFVASLRDASPQAPQGRLNVARCFNTGGIGIDIPIPGPHAHPIPDPHAHAIPNPHAPISNPRIATHIALIAAMCAMAGCARTGPDAADKGIHKTYERGPATLHIRTDRSTLTIAERLTLTLEVVADEPYEVELPAFGEKLDQFGIVDYETIRPELVDDGKVRRGRTYILEPFLSGTYTIPPMTVYFWKRDEEPERTHELESDEFHITVTSLLPESVAALTLHDISGPVALPRLRKPLLLTLPLVVLALIAALVWLVLARRRRTAGAVGPLARITPQEAAYRELEALIAEDLIGRGLIKPFYRKVSDILRLYIERRFGLRAPEQTTEEFLADLVHVVHDRPAGAADSGATAGRRERAVSAQDVRQAFGLPRRSHGTATQLHSGTNRALEQEHKALLQQFLGHCDLVKFAEHQPSTAAIQNTFDSCKTFISQTEAGAS